MLALEFRRLHKEHPFDEHRISSKPQKKNSFANGGSSAAAMSEDQWVIAEAL